ncbi:RYamide receptor-like [Macrobrachium nipponense]|uniref:RYamide receptor-like n=1 Tax=Macrobrachium nipponense TaxID=159736 RepID=UPI0024CB5D6D|nr:neuropeptide Y receptor-like protein [Macrobrachium nipponense]
MMINNLTKAWEASQVDQMDITDEESFPPSVDEIRETCNIELSEMYYQSNETHTFPDYMHCEVCNISRSELDVLVSAGLCTSSYFPYMPLVYVMYSSIFIIALLGNSLVLYTIITSRKMHTVTNLFIANLAVGDLLIMVFCVPFSVASIIVLQHWPFGVGLCVFVNYAQAISIFVSAYTLVAVSIDRYIAIIYPLRPRITTLQAKVIIVLIWSLALLTTLPIAVFSSLHPPDSRVYLVYDKKVCTELWPLGELKQFYSMALMVLQYFLPLLVMIFTYSRIAWKVWGCKKPRRIFQKQAKQGGKALGPGRSLLRKSTSDHSPAKMIRLTLTVVLVYSLCWLPFNMLIVITDFHEELIFWPHIHHVWFVFHWLAMSHACYNPLILCWMNAKFREGYLTFLYHVLPCCKPKISKYLRGMTESSMLQRSHTYSSRFSSTRMSRNTRHPDESRARRESVGSETASVQHPSTAEYPLRIIPGCSCERPSSVVGSVPKEKQIYECLEMSNLP